MKKLRNSILIYTKQMAHTVKRHNLPIEFLHRDAPYFSQWESPELVEDILSGKISAQNDPRWKQSGANTQDEYSLWSSIGCGMACTKMLLAHQTGKAIPLVELGKKCAEYGGYTTPLEKSQGLIHAAFITFLAKEFDVHAKTIFPLLPTEIMYELSQNNYVIASVSPDIRLIETKPKHKGGHLVLMLGYDQAKQLFYFHNPSGFIKQTQEYVSISFADFRKFYSGRGIVVQAN